MSRFSQEPIAIILAGGGGDRLSVLSQKRAIPSIPFAGKYRIIDFTLSNCINSGLTNVLVLTQYRPSLYILILVMVNPGTWIGFMVASG